MGMNSISCEGLYAEVKESGLGEGCKSSSDFDGAGLLVSIGAVAVAALGAAAIAVSLGGKEEEPKGPAESAKIEYGPFHFDESSVKTIHSQYSDKSYRVELENIEHSTYTRFVPIYTGKIMMMLPMPHDRYTGRFNVTDMDTMEKTQANIGNGGCFDVSESLGVCADVGSDFAEVTATETYVKPLE